MSGNFTEVPLSFKVILLGDSGVGKTSFIKQYINNQFNPKTRSTCSVDFSIKKCKLNIFDTAGQERYKSLTRAYFKGTDAVLFLYDMTKRTSFQNIAKWAQYFQDETQSKDQVLVLVGTKKDLLEDKPQQQGPSQQLINRDQIKELVQKYRFTFKFETSAKDNLNIDLVFQQLSRNLIYNSLQRKKIANTIREEDWSVILKRDNKQIAEEESGCC